MSAERETGTRKSWRERRPPEDARVPPEEEAVAGEPGGAPGPEPVEPASREAPPREVERRSGADRRVVDEPVDEERRVEARRQRDRETRERRAYVLDRVTLGVDYLFYLLYGLLGIRFVLGLLGASEGAGFVQFIQGITGPFYAPFSGIVASPSINGGVIEFPIVIALLAYILLHLAVRGLLRLLAGDRVAA